MTETVNLRKLLWPHRWQFSRRRRKFDLVLHRGGVVP